MANILVTGGDGQLGHALRSIAFCGLDTLYFTDAAQLDITDYDALTLFVEENEIDTIVNCAAFTAVDLAEDESELAYKVNEVGPRTLARVASENDALLIHISTDYVFDGTADVPLKEKVMTSPINVYGASKLAGEKAIKKSGCIYIILRTSWLYSEYGHNFMKTIDRLSEEKEELRVVNDQFGTPTYAVDLAKAIKTITEDFDVADKQGIYHYSGNGVASWFDFASKIVALNGNNCRVEPVGSEEFPTKAARPKYSVLDKTKITNTFDIVIPKWEDALVECMERYIKIKA